MGAAAVRLNLVSRRKSPSKPAVDPNEWWDQQCKKSGYYRLAHNIHAELLRPGLLMGGDSQLRLILHVIDKTHGAAEKTDARGNKTPRPVATPWMNKAAIAKLAGLKGDDRRQVDNILIDGETRGLFICEAGDRGLYRFTLTPWLWKDAPDYKLNTIPKKPVVAETEESGISDSEPQAPTPKPLRLEPVTHEPGKPPPKPLTFPVSVTHQINFDFSKCHFPVSVQTHIERGRILHAIVSLSRDVAAPSTQSIAQMGENYVENKGPRSAEIVTSDRAALERIFDGADGNGIYSRWKRHGGSRESARRAFITTFQNATSTVRQRFARGFESWVSYYDTVSWDKCGYKLTFEHFVRERVWESDAPATHGKSKTEARAEADGYDPADFEARLIARQKARGKSR